MADPETVALPRSGKSMTWSKGWGGYELAILPGVDANLGRSSDGTWDAWIDHDDSASLRGTQAECIAWLDDHVMELRAALLPPGAFVVADGPETLHLVTNAIGDAIGCDGNGSNEDAASAVLAALREAGK